MSEVLNSLVISESFETQRKLEKIMSNKIGRYTPKFSTCGVEDLEALDTEPGLIFIANRGGDLSVAAAQAILRRFADKACILLDEHPETIRQDFIRLGMSEVMSLGELQSQLGKNLVEKLLVIAELAETERHVEQSEERFRSIIENSHDMITMMDEEGTILYTSPAFARQMRYEAWEVLGKPLFDFVHDDEMVSVKEQFRNILGAAPTEEQSIELRLKHQDGTWRHIEATASNLLADMAVEAVVLNFRDVTPHKQIESELAESRKKLEKLLEERTKEAEDATRMADTVLSASPDTLIAIDDKGYIVFASEHYRVRYPNDSYAFEPGTHILDAFDVVARHIMLSASDPRYEEMKKWWQDPEGSREFRLAGGMWTRMQAKRMEGSSHIVISTTDITDYKRQQSKLAAQSDELLAALATERAIVEQQKTFISMVSHEFRTPLTIIDGNAQILQSRGSELPKEMVEKRSLVIRSAVDRLVRLIETILSAHMLESGKMSLQLEACDLGQIIEAVCSDQQDVSPHHKIRASFWGLPEKQLLDAKMIRQVVSNLVSNAVKYSPDKPDIDVRGFREHDKVVIEVTDHGLGIPETELPRIFSKYFRASTSGGIPGSGLGLSLVKQFVELHGGKVNLRSKVGIGTVITAELPIKMPAAAEAAEDLAQNVEAG